MSLRWRLTLLSTLVITAVFAIFGGLAFLTVQHFFYSAIDESMAKQSAANKIYLLARAPNFGEVSDLGSSDSVSTIFFMVFDPAGRIYSADRQIPYSDSQFTRALDRETVQETNTLADGGRVRVLMQPVVSRGEVIAVLLAAIPLQMVDQLLRELRTFLFIAALVLLVVAAGGSYVLTGRALREVEKVTSKARQIERSADLSQRIPEPTSDDEVGSLVRTFNRMLERLQSAFDAQRRFVADSSHELRTPLTVIQSNLHILKRTTDPTETKELFSVTEAEVARLNRMVNDLLYMAQMQAGHTVTPALRPVELDSLLLEVFARARAMAATKQQKVALAHEDISTILGDSDQLQHLLLNLLENAVKYSPPESKLSLGLWRDGDHARIEVTDSGPGIAQEEIPRIFERFFRTQTARDNVRSGSGLGLAIVKSIANAHNARIEISSEIGRGSTFRLLLPLYKSEAAPPSVVQSNPEVTPREERVLVGPGARGESAE